MLINEFSASKAALYLPLHVVPNLKFFYQSYNLAEYDNMGSVLVKKVN